MEQKKVRGFGFRGWMLILYQAIAYITFQCFTQYPLNILADFYGGSQKVANIYSICAVVGILVQIVLAGVVAKMKKIKLFGTILGAVTLVLAFLVMTLPAGTGWDVSYAIINVVSVLYATFALGILVGQWFPTRKGIVMGIATLAFPIANGLLGPFASAVFAKGFPDIKGAFLPFFIVSVIGWIIGIIFIKDYPEECGAFRDNDQSMTPEVARAIMEQEIENKKTTVWKLGHTLGCRDFWFITIPLGCLLMFSVGTMTLTQPICAAVGIVDDGYTTTMAMIMIFGLVGSYILGILDTRLGTRKSVLIALCVMVIAGILGFVSSPGAPGLLRAALICLAIFMGASSNYTVSAAAQYWRREDFSSVFACVNPIANILASSGPLVIARLIATRMGYNAIFLVTGIVGVVCIVLTALFKPGHVKETDDKYRAAAGKPLDDALVGRK